MMSFQVYSNVARLEQEMLCWSSQGYIMRSSLKLIKYLYMPNYELSSFHMYVCMCMYVLFF